LFREDRIIKRQHPCREGQSEYEEDRESDAPPSQRVKIDPVPMASMAVLLPAPVADVESVHLAPAHVILLTERKIVMTDRTQSPESLPFHPD
jgi:hypothetical protein